MTGEEFDAPHLTPGQKTFLEKERRKNEEKHSAMRQCPAICLMAIATMRNEKVLKFVPQEFWQRKAFCIEAAKQSTFSLDYIPEQWCEALQAVSAPPEKENGQK